MEVGVLLAEVLALVEHCQRSHHHSAVEARPFEVLPAAISP